MRSIWAKEIKSTDMARVEPSPVELRSESNAIQLRKPHHRHDPHRRAFIKWFGTGTVVFVLSVAAWELGMSSGGKESTTTNPKLSDVQKDPYNKALATAYINSVVGPMLTQAMSEGYLDSHLFLYNPSLDDVNPIIQNSLGSRLSGQDYQQALAQSTGAYNAFINNPNAADFVLPNGPITYEKQIPIIFIYTTSLFTSPAVSMLQDGDLQVLTAGLLGFQEAFFNGISVGGVYVDPEERSNQFAVVVETALISRAELEYIGERMNSNGSSSYKDIVSTKLMLVVASEYYSSMSSLSSWNGTQLENEFSQAAVKTYADIQISQPQNGTYEIVFNAYNPPIRIAVP